MSLAERLAAAPSVGLARRALAGAEGVWIAGGAVRDAALGREVVDLDLAMRRRSGAGCQGDRPRGQRPRLRALGRVRDLAGRRRRRFLADRRHRVARRDDRGGPGGARLHDRRGCRAARRWRADRPLRRARRSRPPAAACGGRAQLRRRPAAAAACCPAGGLPGLRRSTPARSHWLAPKRLGRPSPPASASWSSCASWSAAPTRCGAWGCSTSSASRRWSCPSSRRCAGSSRGRTTTSTSTATRWRCWSVRSRSRTTWSASAASGRRSWRRCSPSRLPTR